VSLVEEDQLREYSSKLDMRKSMDPDGRHPLARRELASVITRPLSIIFEYSWEVGEVPKDWRKANATPIFKKEEPGNYSTVNPTLMR